MLAAATFDSTAVTLLVAGGAVGALFALVVAVRYATTFPALPVPGPETSDLGLEPPAVANLLVNRCKVTNAAAAATLVDLAARRHLELFEVGPDRFVVRLASASSDPLTRYETQVMDLVRARATGGSAPLEAIQVDEGRAASWRGRFAKSVLADARSRGLIRGRWSHVDWLLFVLLSGAAVFLVAVGLYVAHVEQMGHLARGSSRRFAREDWFYVAAGGWALLVAAVERLRSVRYAREGSAAAARWLGVRRFLRHDPTFGDAPPAAVAIWNRLLAYGAALGVARGVARAIPLDAEDRNTAWSRAGGDWHQVHVEYPRHFGYGQPPIGVFIGGLARTLFWGALAFAGVPLAANALWNAGSDAIDRTTVNNALVVGAVALFFVVFGVILIGLLLRFADGLVRVWRGGRDLGDHGVVEGVVVKSLPEDQWFAVDPGHVDHVRAWHPGALGLPARGETVRVGVTRRLGHVSAITVLEAAPAGPATATLATAAPVSWSAPATGPGAAAPAPVAALDAATVQACTGVALPEVDPATIADLPERLPRGTTTRAFSDGTSRVVVGHAPEGAGWPTSGATSVLAERLASATAAGRWTQDRMLVQLVPSGLLVVEVELAGRSSADREQVARTLAARLGPAAAPSAPPGG